MAGLSPLVAREIVFLAGGDTDTPVGRFCDPGAMRALSEAFFSVLKRAQSGAVPVLLTEAGESNSRGRYAPGCCCLFHRKFFNGSSFS